MNIDRRGFLGSSLATLGAAGVDRSRVGAGGVSAQQGDVTRVLSRKSLSRQFAQWVVGLRYEDLPAAVVDRVKGLTLQNLASALVGSQLPAGRQAVALVTNEEAGVRSGASILVSGSRVTRGGAAFANSELMLAGGKWDTFRMLTQWQRATR
jgi:hypothetical protein